MKEPFSVRHVMTDAYPDTATRPEVSEKVCKFHRGWITVTVLLSTHADRQGVDISFTVCLCVCVCVFLRLRIFSPAIKLAASNFSRLFIGVQGNHTFFVNFAPPEAHESASARATPTGI